MSGLVRRRVRLAYAALAWLALAAAAAAVGVVAVRAIGSGLVGTSTATVTKQQVERALTATSSATSSPSPAPPTPTATASRKTTPTAPAAARVLGTRGGSVIAQCTAGRAALLSWSPAQGFEADDVSRGPAATATLTFEAEHTDIQVTVDCRGSVPEAHVTTHTDGDDD